TGSRCAHVEATSASERAAAAGSRSTHASASELAAAAGSRSAHVEATSASELAAGAGADGTPASGSPTTGQLPNGSPLGKRYVAPAAEAVGGGDCTRNLMVVGDDAQSIYGFRAASIRNILDFPNQFPGARRITLEQNYRSTKPILDVSNAVIAYARERFPKNLWPVRPGGARPVLLTCSDEAEQSTQGDE